MLDVALSWLDKGVVPIRVITNGKIPAFPWSEWQHELPTKEQVRYWFHGWHGNLALVTGGSSGLVVLDFDSFPLYCRWRIDHPEASKSYTVTTPGHGRHVYFWSMARVESTTLSQCEIKGAGSLITAPPSRINWKPYVGNDAEIMTIERLADVVDVPPVDNSGTNVPEPLRPPEEKKSLRSAGIRLRRGLADDIKERLPMYALASQYTDLFPSSSDGVFYMGKCPVHDDKSPSFYVNTATNKCGCHASRCVLNRTKGNDVLDFYMAVNNVSNREAMYALAQEVGLME